MGTIFSAYDIRGHADDTLTVEHAWTVGKAFSEWLPEQGDVVVIKTANANKEIAHGFTEGILLQGRSVIDGGEGDQQAVVSAINENHSIGGALVGHDDIQNLEVIALFDSHGGVITDASGLPALHQLVDSGNFLPAPEKGQLKSADSK